MGKAVGDLFLVLGGAVGGAIASAILFAIVFALIGKPSGESAVLFGVTFGAMGGVGIAVAAAQRGEAEASAVDAASVAGIIVAGLALLILFTNHTWSRIFPEGGTAILAPWAAITAWLANVAGRKR